VSEYQGASWWREGMAGCVPSFIDILHAHLISGLHAWADITPLAHNHRLNGSSSPVLTATHHFLCVSETFGLFTSDLQSYHSKCHPWTPVLVVEGSVFISPFHNQPFLIYDDTNLLVHLLLPFTTCVLKSSRWWQRFFCGRCGSCLLTNLWYSVVFHSCVVLV